MANLGEAAMLQSSVSQINQIIAFLDRALSQHTPLFEFLLPDLQVFTFPIEAGLSPINLSNQFTLSFDSSFLSEHSGSVLKMAFLRYNVFLPITASTTRTVSPILMVWVERAGIKLEISNLMIPFNMSFPLDQRIPQIQQTITDIHIDNSKTEAEALAEGALSCQFYNQTTNALSTEGCQPVALTAEGRLVCACSHMTSFGAFL